MARKRNRGLSFSDLATSKVGRANKHKIDLALSFASTKKTETTNKYKAVSKVVDGIKFASTGEAERYVQLKGYERLGMIKDLRLQVWYELTPKMETESGEKIKPSHYIADFVYFNKIKNKEVVEDFKGKRTQLYIDKKKQMMNVRKIEIYETNKKHIKDGVL